MRHGRALRIGGSSHTDVRGTTVAAGCCRPEAGFHARRCSRWALSPSEVEMKSVAATAAAKPAFVSLSRRFEAIIIDWDGTAVPEARAGASRLRKLLEQAAADGLELAVLSGMDVENVDGQLAARPAGPGGLILGLNRGSEVFSVDRNGPQLAFRRIATADEDAALSRAAQLTVERLAARGLGARIVSERTEPPQDRPDPRTRVGGSARRSDSGAARCGGRVGLAAAGIAGLPEAVKIARDAAAEAGLADPRVTSDAKHVEIGLTDKSDSARWIMRWLWARGIAPDQVLIAGDELGPLVGLPGSDSPLLAEAWSAPDSGVGRRWRPACSRRRGLAGRRAGRTCTGARGPDRAPPARRAAGCREDPSGRSRSRASIRCSSARASRC